MGGTVWLGLTGKDTFANAGKLRLAADGADVQVLNEGQDAGPGVGSSDADMVQAFAVAQGDGAAGVDPVGAGAVVAVGDAVRE